MQMNKTFGTMKTNVGENIQDTSSQMLSVIGVYLNNRLSEVRERLNLFGTESTAYTFSTVSGTQDYVMPDDFGKETTVLDITNNVELTAQTTQEWAQSNAGNISAPGTATKYVILTDVVYAQPTSASVVTIYSDSASDSQVIHVRGIVSGIEKYENITLNGTSFVSGTISFDKITGISKSGVTVGTITITSNVTTVTVAVLAPNALVSRVKKMRLSDIPNGVVTIRVMYLSKQLPMVSDYDYPEVDCEDCIELGATADSWRYKRQFAKAQQFEGLFEKALSTISFSMANQPNLTNRFNPKPYPRNIY